jgi:Cu-Zn family superoxide dismutase
MRPFVDKSADTSMIKIVYIYIKMKLNPIHIKKQEDNMSYMYGNMFGSMPGSMQGSMLGRESGSVSGKTPGIQPQSTMAFAEIIGGPLAPQIRGIVRFIDVQGGTWVVVNVTGLPEYKPGKDKEKPIGPHGFHIHEKGICEVGNPKDPFLAAGAHWNPTNQPHGNHAGDFPVLFSNNGMTAMAFFTNKFKPFQAIGKSVIIHQNPDDYQTQPAGGAGKRLACGIIKMAH